MTKEKIISKLASSISQFSDYIIYSYIAGSFNTPFFSEHSDVDLILIWKEVPSLQLRSEVLNQIISQIQQEVFWIFTDSVTSVSRDAVKFKSFRKIEIYNYDLSSLQILLEKNDIDGFSYNILQRFPLQDAPDFELFLDSYKATPEEIREKKRDLFFSIMSDHENNISSPQLIDKIFQLTLLTTFEATPPKKHWANAIGLSNLSPDKQRALNSLLHSDIEGVLLWIDSHQDFIVSMAEIHLDEQIPLHANLTLNRLNPKTNTFVFQLVQEQRERLTSFLSWPSKIKTLEDQKAFSVKAVYQWDRMEALHFQIIAEDIFVGAISIHSFNWNKRSFEFGYWIDQKHEGQGHITRGVSALIKQMVDHGWQQVIITSDRSNVRSRKIAERLGMTNGSTSERNGKNYIQFRASSIPISS